MTGPAILSQVTGDSPRARRGDPETSHAAADSISPEALEASEVEVLAILAEAEWPLISDAIAQVNVRRAWQGQAERAWSASRIRTAIKQLAEAGRIVKDGEGLTDSGRRAARWRIA